jgi:hypothetical protein
MIAVTLRIERELGRSTHFLNQTDIPLFDYRAQLRGNKSRYKCRDFRIDAFIRLKRASRGAGHHLALFLL